MSIEQKEQLLAAIDYVKDPIVFYEFGVHEGSSIRLFRRLCEERNRKIGQIYAFDSFQGLPPEYKDVPKWDGFAEGAFALSSSPKEVIERETGAIVIEGYFVDSLKLDQIESKYGKLLRASIIHCDADLYISTYQALDFMFANDLAPLGCVIAFDEYDSIKDGGEEQAWKEICDSYALEVEEVCCIQGLFRMPNFVVKNRGRYRLPFNKKIPNVSIEGEILDIPLYRCGHDS